MAPDGRDTRPTLDRVREAMFNSLESMGAVRGARVLDLFAGSGALGVEALSRGAGHATFVDPDRAARRAVSENLRATGLIERAEVVAATATTFLSRSASAEGDSDGATTGEHSFDLVLLDPPYATDDGAWATLLAAVAPTVAGGVVVTESDRSLSVPVGWHALRAKRYGGTLVAILKPPNTSPEPL